MPLLPGKNEIGHNIKEMEKAGHPHNQAVAASLNKARESGADIPFPQHLHSPKPRGHHHER